MFCTKCNELCATVSGKLEVNLFRSAGEVQRVDCGVCRKFLVINVDGEILDVNEVLEEAVDGWRKVRTNRDKLVYYVLSQIIYPEIDTPRKEEFEAFYDFADDCDHVYLRWLGGRPVGFYTVKPKGSEISNMEYKYSMHTIDTAYIRSQYRNQGLGMEILYDGVSRYQDQDLGFSKPISCGMLRVIKRFLMKHTEYRLHFWEIENGGIEGFAKVIWFNLRKQIHQK